MRKVYVNVTVRLILQTDEDVDIDVAEVIQEMDYDFTANQDSNAEIIDSEIVEYEVYDSK